MSTHDLERLGKTVKARRLALYESRVAAAKAAGISKDTWKRVEEGEPVRDGTYVKVDPALNWAPGSCAAVLEGREAMSVGTAEEAPDVVTTVIPSEALDEAVRDIVQLASIATTKGLTSDEIRALSDRVVRDLKKRGIF